MQLIDTHCHLDAAEFAADRDVVLAAARAAGVDEIVVPAVAASGWDGLLAFCAREPGVLPALGLHPVYLEDHREHDVAALAARIDDARPIAVGEIGLDYYVEALDRDRQLRLFEAQLEVARAAELPVLLHVRRAHFDVLPRLRRARLAGGIAHAFNGSLEEARQYIDLGFRLGFGGMMTYPRSTRIRALARELPLDAIVLETDAPDLTPAAHHGERNSPAYLPLCLAELAALREETVTAVAAATTANARAVLRLSPEARSA